MCFTPTTTVRRIAGGQGYQGVRLAAFGRKSYQPAGRGALRLRWMGAAPLAPFATRGTAHRVELLVLADDAQCDQRQSALGELGVDRAKNCTRGITLWVPRKRRRGRDG